MPSSTDLRELRRLERWFYRAPSAHNTQPWLLAYERDRIKLGFDPDRHLAVGDPTRRDLLLSLGAFVETVLVTCAAEGIPVHFAPLDEIGEFVPSDRVYETPFGLDDLERRRTSRLRYKPGRLPAEMLAGVRRHLGTEERLHELGARDVWPLFAIADRHMYESEATIRELRRWLRLSNRHPDYHRDGLTYECLDLSAVEARAFALLLRPTMYRLVKATRLHRAFTAASKSLLDVEGSVLVLDRVNSADILASGRSLMRVWLELSAASFYTHPLSQIIDHEVTERELARRLDLSDQQRVLSVFRVGRSDEPARSHRLA